MINPKTGYVIKQGARTYKALLDEFTPVNGVLVPKNTNAYAYSNVKQYWVPTSKLPKPYVKSGNLVRLDREYIITPNGRHIVKSSPGYQKWLNLGYKDDHGKFINPSTTTMAIYNSDIKDLVARIRLYEVVNHVSITYMRIYNRETHESNIYPINSDSSIFHAIFTDNYDADEFDNMDIELFLSNPKISHGPLFDGNTNCFIELLKDHLINNPRLLKKIDPMFKEFEDGVFAEDIESISKALKTPIVIHTSSDTIRYGEANSNRSILHVKTTKNHAILYANVKREDPTYVRLDNSDITECDDIFEYRHTDIKTELIRIACEDYESIRFVRLDKHGSVLGFETDDCIYKYKNDKGFELSDTEYSCHDKAYNHALTLFSEPIQTCKFEVNLCKPICFTKALKGTYDMLDIKSAYNHFPSLPGDLKQVVKTDKRLDVPHAFYDVEFFCPIEKRLKQDNISDYCLSVFEKHDYEIKIMRAYVSSYTVDIDISSLLEYGKREWHMIVGKFQRNMSSKTFITTHPEEAMRYGGRHISETDLFICDKDRKFSHSRYYPHVASAVIGYTNAVLYDYALSNPEIEVVRCWVDSLVCELPAVIPDHFSIKQNTYDTPANRFASYAPIDCQLTELVKLPRERVFIYHGSAGTGKSTIAKHILKNIPSSIVLAPTNLVCSMYERSYTIDSWINNSNGMIPYNKYNLIILDEFSMVDNSKLRYLLNTFSTYRFILFGDPKQLCPINGVRISIDAYPNQELHTVYRQTDESFISELEEVYKSCNPLDLLPIDIDTAISQKAIFVCCLNEHVDMINARAYELSTDIVLSDTIKSNMPAFVNSNKYRRTLGVAKNELCIVIDKKTVSIADVRYCIDVSDCIPAVSVTCHKLQGQTIDGILVVDIRGIYKFTDRNSMLYTMYTRVRDRTQLRSMLIDDQGAKAP